MSLFRSEPVIRCQLILQSEAAYQCVAELGEINAVQFLDANPELSAFQRKFVGEIKRCEELERILRFINKEAIGEGIIARDPREQPKAPNPRAISDLETDLQQSEKTLSDLTNNYRALLKSQQELNELKNVLRFADHVLRDSAEHHQNGAASEAVMADTEVVNVASMKFNVSAGVIETHKLASFEKILWRISKGNVFLKSTNLDDPSTDLTSGESVYKSLFLLFFQGEELKTRAKKICEGYHASVYPCPDSHNERQEMLAGVEARLNDLEVVLRETCEHRIAFLNDKTQHLKKWLIEVRKMKATYHCLNSFNFDVSEKAMVGECWMPQFDIPEIKDKLNHVAQECGSTIAPILNEITVDEMPPTYNRTNKYTAGFQMLVDAYGANSYREVNPAVYTIATFPFLFAVMFGDAGHGLIMMIFGLILVLREKSFEKKDYGEIFNIFFGGRYIITAMGALSIYTGLIYNDIFSKSFNIFGSHWAWRDDFQWPLNSGTAITMDPGNFTQYKGDSYYFGIDPIWQLASNKIMFLNGYKMKISLIFGLIHMMFGVSLSAWQKVIKRKYAEIFLEVIPQIVFLLFVFCYLIFIIFFKWVHYYADTANKDTNKFSEHCAPNLLITFINMMLFKEDRNEELEKICGQNYLYMYSGQAVLQKFLVVTGVLMVPIMLLGKPLYNRSMQNRQRRLQSQQNDQEHLLDSPPDSGNEEEPFSEVMIYQGIHTIEYVLGSVSHTASYLRLWALSLAHSQLSEVLWNMVMTIGFSRSYVGAILMYFIFSAWAALTLSILVLMEGLSAFLHTLRLHWVEFQSKFYEGQGTLFHPFSFDRILKEYAESDKVN